MGGFYMEVSSANSGLPFVPGNQRLTISARGVALLAKCGHLPNIPEEDIVDKSKADGLAKFFVCLQAGWMLVQVIARAILNLPVTLLEVNTLGHVLCAFVIYVLWWHKPRLVRESTRLEGDWVEALYSYMYMSSQVSGQSIAYGGKFRRKILPRMILRQAWTDPEFSALSFFLPRSGRADDNKTEMNPPEAIELLDAPNVGFKSASGHQTGDTALIPKSESDLHLGYFTPHPRSPNRLEGSLSPGILEQAQDPSTSQLSRWRLAAEAVHMYPAIRQRFTTKDNLSLEAKNLNCDCFKPTTEELMTRVATDWPANDLLRGTRGVIMGMVLWFASMAYGSVHIAAWHDHFPTDIEAWMWRISAMYITGSGLLWATINLLAHEVKFIDDFWDDVVALRAHWSSYVILGSVCSVCGVAYIFARIYLVVEAFISIRQLPLGAYNTPDWTQFIPHL
jgi:hypothetical protein